MMRSPFILPLVQVQADAQSSPDAASRRRLIAATQGGALYTVQSLPGGQSLLLLSGQADGFQNFLGEDQPAYSAWGYTSNASSQGAGGTGTWDRLRGNFNEAVFASAVRAATVASADFTNFNGRGLIAVLDVTAVPGVQTVSLELQGKDAVSGQYYTVLASAAIAAISTTVLRWYPGTAVVANLAADHPLPRTWRARVVHSGAGNFTYSVGASVVW